MFRGRLQYLVQWKGYSYEHNSWEDATDVQPQKLVTEFYSTHPELHAKYVELILTTYLSNPLKTVVPGRHSLEGGDVRGPSISNTDSVTE